MGFFRKKIENSCGVEGKIGENSKGVVKILMEFQGSTVFENGYPRYALFLEKPNEYSYPETINNLF